jgi:hypothetical protein
MKMSHRLYMVSLFRDGLINLVATLSGGMIRLMVSLSNRISSLPPISMSFSFDYISIYAHDHFVLDLSLLFHMIKHRGRYFDEMLKRLHWLYEFT